MQEATAHNLLGKAAIAAQRTDRLAQRNPHRIQRQIDDLKASSPTSARDKKTLEDLEKELARIKKAKEAVGDKFTSSHGDSRGGRGGGGRGGGRGGVLGKRSRDGGSSWGRDEEDSEDTDPEVRSIPMPRDTPPPIPHRRAQRGPNVSATNANATPLGVPPGGGERLPHALPDKPVVAPPAPVQTVYESKPIIRDLRKEAVNFVPAAVQRKLNAAKGVGRLVDEEEMDRLEKEGYVAGQNRKEEEGDGAKRDVEGVEKEGEDEDVTGAEMALEELEELEKEFQREPGGYVKPAVEDADDDE